MGAYLTDNQLALICITLVVIVACIILGESAKELVLSAVAGIVGWLSRGEVDRGKVQT